ncbi:unnamed protein product, partial [Meganyctiphanes norvegica]
MGMFATYEGYRIESHYRLFRSASLIKSFIEIIQLLILCIYLVRLIPYFCSPKCLLHQKYVMAEVKVTVLNAISHKMSMDLKIYDHDHSCRKSMNWFLASIQQSLLFFTTSYRALKSSEAVDLALQLVRLYTQRTEVLIVDNAFHGSIDSVHNLSPKVFKQNNITKADWVHVLTMPDLYRGPYQDDDPNAVEKYIDDARKVIENIKHNGKKLACFIAEPMLTITGCLAPPAKWLQAIYRMVKESGGLCIADEVQTALGRVGSHLWSFQAQGVTPDLIILGKPLGQNLDLEALIFPKSFGGLVIGQLNIYKCSPMMDSVGCSVLNIMQKEHLVNSAQTIGEILKHELNQLKKKHQQIGEVRGMGLMYSIEMVWSKQSRKPAKEIAEEIVYKMKEEYILIANEGEHRNILLIMPPMCFTVEDSYKLVRALDKVITTYASQNIEAPITCDFLNMTIITPKSFLGINDGRLGIFQPQEEDDISLPDPDPMNLDDAQLRYQDLEI